MDRFLRFSDRMVNVAQMSPTVCESGILFQQTFQMARPILDRSTFDGFKGFLEGFLNG